MMTLSEIKGYLAQWPCNYYMSAALGLGLVYIIRQLFAYKRRSINKARIVERQKEREKKFESWRDTLNAEIWDKKRQQSIIQLPFKELQQQLQNGQLSPIEVLQAYQRQALIAHGKTNCLVELVDEAQAWAESLERKSSPKGPLYGIPVSFKENYPIEGYDVTEGCSEYLYKPYPADCLSVKAMKLLGAIPFARTNLPQLGSSHESSNPIYGRTTHPQDRKRSPGGSSSGEGALLALKGSPLGWGSDTGGSIRCPAAFCGLYAIKPTSGRISVKGRVNDNGQNVTASVSCPIARDVDTLTEMLRLMSSPKIHELDPGVPPIPFDEQAYSGTKPLRIGYFVYDGHCHPVPACARVVREAAQKLRERGHQVVEWTPPNASEGLFLNVMSITADGGEEFLDKLCHDQIDSSLTITYMMYRLPKWFRRMLSWLIAPLNKNTSKILRMSCGMSSVGQWWKHTVKTKEWIREFTESWKQAGLDAVLCPAFGCPPLTNGSGTELLFNSSYNMMFNVLDYPAGVVPYSYMSLQDMEDIDNKYPSKFLYKSVKKKLVGGEGLPLSVQVVTLPWQEEACLRVMSEIKS